MRYINDGFELFAVICAICSSISSFSVILTGIVFPSMLKKMFMRFIVLISLCYFISSTMYALGYPKSNESLCPLQGGVSNFFLHASLFWATILTYQVYSLVILNKYFLKEYQTHLFCWSVSLLVTLLPLTTSTEYGQDDMLLGKSWCTLRTGNGSSLTKAIWGIIAVALPFFICIIIMIIIYCRLKYYFYFLHEFTMDQALIIKSTAETLLLYPLTMIIFWVPILFIANGFTFIDNRFHYQAYSISWSIATFYGTIFAIIYFTHSTEARYRWKKLILYIFYNNNSIKNENETEIIIDFNEMNDNSYNNSNNNSNNDLFKHSNSDDDIEWRTTLSNQRLNHSISSTHSDILHLILSSNNNNNETNNNLRKSLLNE